jgi:hypothetical protein
MIDRREFTSPDHGPHLERTDQHEGHEIWLFMKIMTGKLSYCRLFAIARLLFSRMDLKGKYTMENFGPLSLLRVVERFLNLAYVYYVQFSTYAAFNTVMVDNSAE